MKQFWIGGRVSVASAFERAQGAYGALEKKNQQEFRAQCKELDKSVVHFLKNRREFHRCLSRIEAKLQGKAQEREAVETFVRTQPRLGKRKRDEAIPPTMD